MEYSYDYDIVILGGGSAGIVAGVMAGALGLRVLLIEKEKMGGECLNTGCVPSKALLHAAKVAQTIRTASQVGLVSHSVTRGDTKGVLARVREMIGAVEAADATTQMLRDNGVEIRMGAAHFVGPHTLALAEGQVTAQNFILATGSRPVVPDVPGLAEVGYLTNRTVFDLDEIPGRLLVVGGGPNGVEMAQAFHRLGSHVTLIEAEGRLLTRDDGELAAALEAHLRREGLDIRLQTPLHTVRRTEEGCVATVMEADGRTSEIPFDRILIAVGRAPNTEGLHLEAAHVACDDKRVQADAFLRTTAPHIFVCGDLLGAYQFSHMAEYEAKTVVRNIVFPGESRAEFRIDPWATFTDPEVVHLGLTEDEAKARHLPYEVYRQAFAQNDRAITDNATEGFIKVLTQGLTGKILGVHIYGPHGSEMIQEWTLAMQQGLTVRAIADLIHVYPTLSMVCQHAAQRWYERKAQEPLIAGALDAYVHAVRPRQKAWALGALGVAAGLGALGLRRLLTRPDGRSEGSD